MDHLSVNPIVILSSGFMVMPLASHRYPTTLDGLDTVYNLYKDYKAKLAETNTFGFYKHAAETCAYTYGDFLQWAKVHAMAAKISATQFDFIIDTIRFIKTGRRATSLTLWARLIKYEPNLQITEQQHAVRLAIVEKELLGLSNNPVPLWCSHESGINDLIVATAIMFGGIQNR